MQIPYWFSNDEVARIQSVNLPFFKQDDLENMVKSCFRIPQEGENGEWMLCKDVYETLQGKFPHFVGNPSTKVKIGFILKFMGCTSQHSKNGQKYQLVSKLAA